MEPNEIREALQGEIDRYRSMLPPVFREIFDELVGVHGVVCPAVESKPRADPADRLPRRRNPRIGCERYESGTWIHGDPHDCPKGARR